MGKMYRRSVILFAGLSLMAASPAFAKDGGLAPLTVSFGEAEAPVHDIGAARVWQVRFDGRALDSARLDLVTLPAAVARDGEQARTTAVTYSDGYQLRARIHKMASFATLPLFAAQYVLGNKLDEGGASETVRATHAGIATAMVGLFGVNTVTGVWNMWEARNDPNGKTRRLTHGILMLASDAGFVATGLLAPTNDGGGNRDLHKSVAITSIALATTGYLIMLFH